MLTDLLPEEVVEEMEKTDQELPEVEVKEEEVVEEEAAQEAAEEAAEEDLDQEAVNEQTSHLLDDLKTWLDCFLPESLKIDLFMT